MALAALVVFNLVWVLGLVWSWHQHVILFVLLLAAGVVTSVLFLRRTLLQQASILHLLEDGLLHMLDNNFAISLPSENAKNSAKILSLFNQVTDKLRVERQHIFQRELLLDKVVNESSVVTVLVNHKDIIVFANHAAKQWFEPSSKAMIGANWTPLFQEITPLFYQQLSEQGSAICTVEMGDARSQSWHVSRSPLKLNGASHTLYLFKPMTEALNKQELEIWKKAIRVISHELNNSIAPISSLCHSGRLLSQPNAVEYDAEKLERVFNGISRRVNHLNDFVKSYGKLARLGTPDKERVNTLELLQDIQLLYQCALHVPEYLPPLHIDKAQVEQALINLVKNANDAASAPSAVTITANALPTMVTIMVEDDGQGIPDDVIHQVMLPFFSTKQGGTGVGLAICKNVAEAHSGSLTLRNKENGGLIASLSLPLEN